MAYGLKYTSSFYSEAWSGTTSAQYTLKIYKEGFSGSSEEVCMGGSPCTEKAINSDDLPWGVKGCRYEFQVVSDTLSVNDFYTEDGKDFLFELYEAGTPDILIRKGYLISEDVSEEYSDGTKTITITGTDGLELLKTINYELIEDKDYQGIASVFSILFNCLDKIGLGIKFNTAFNYYPNGITAGDGVDSLAFHSLHQELWKGLTCYEVLERLTSTHQCALEQEDGEWWYIHKINPSDATVTYRKWTSFGALIDDYTLPEPIDVVFEGEYAPVERPQVLKNRPYKRVISEVDLKGYENKLRNADFQDGFLQWNQDPFSPVDSYSFGGLGTNKDPYYVQINGYDPNTKDIFGEPNTRSNRIYQEVETIYNSAIDTGGVSSYLNKGITISGKCIGNGVKRAACQVILRMTFDGYSPSVDFTLSENGEWVDSSELSNKDPEYINVPLIYDDGLNKDEYTSFRVESKNIGSAVITKNFYHRIFANKLWKLKVEDMTSCKVLFTLQEGVEQTTITSSPEWVRWADLKMELIDRTRSVGLKKNRYISQKSGVAPNELKIERYFADFYESEQFISILGGDGETPTSLWTTTNNNNTGDLLTALTRELFSLYYKPVSLYDGNILGRVKKYHTINLVDYSEPLFNINWSYDFGRNIVDGSRYIMTFPEYVGNDNKKYGVYNDDKEILYDGEFPTGQLDFDEVPILNGDLIAKNLTKINQNTVFDDYLTFSKISNESGINWYDSLTGDKTDYFVTSDEGFKFKSASSDFEVNLDFSELTADTILKVPVLAGISTIATDTTAWMLNGNTLLLEGKLGSINNETVRLVANDQYKISLIASGGIMVHHATTFEGDVLSEGNITIEKGNPRLRLRDTSHAGHTQGFDIHVSVDEFRIDDNTHSKNILRNYLNSSVHTTDFDAEVYNFKNGGTAYATLNSTGLGVGTASPSGKAEIQSIGVGNHNTLVLSRSSTNANDKQSIVFRANDFPFNYASITGTVTSGSTAELSFSVMSSSTLFEAMRITSSGNVGIGTTSPNYKLDVVTTSWNGMQITTGGSDRNNPALDLISGSVDMVISPDNVNGKSWVGNYSNHGLSFHTNNIERVTILAGGNVGIGTTSPSELLHVNGTTRTINLKITNGAMVGYVWQCNNADGSGVWTSPLTSERYIGEWAANSGSAPSGSPTTGDYWVVNTAGTYSGTTYAAGDEIYWNGSTWLKRSNYLTLPTASASVLGGIKIGTGLSIDGSGIVSVGTLNQNTTGSAATLTTTRNIAISGDLTWNVNFNGSANVTAVGTLATITDSNTGTFLKITRNTKGLVIGTQAVASADIMGLIDVYTKSESDGTYVKLTGDENVDGIKTFLTDIKVSNNQIHLTEAFFNRNGVSSSYGSISNKLGAGGLLLDVLNGGGLYFRENTTRKALFDTNGLILSNSLGNSDIPTERLDVRGNIRYSQTLKPNNQTPTAGMFLKAPIASTNEWAFIGHADISNLASYTGFDTRYFTETESDDRYQPKDADLTSIAGLIGTTGILRKTAANSWSLDTTEYLNSTNLTVFKATTSQLGVVSVGATMEINGFGVLNQKSGVVSANTYTKVTVDTYGRVIAGTSLLASDIPSLDASKITTGTIPDARIASASTWNAKQNALNGTGFVKIAGTTISYDDRDFVDTSTTQSAIAGNKTFTGLVNFNSQVRFSGTYGLRISGNNTYNGETSVSNLFFGDQSIGAYTPAHLKASKFMFTHGFVKLGGTSSTDFGVAWPTERLDIDGNIRISGSIKPDNVAPTAGYFLKGVDADNMAWSQLTVDDISDIDSLYQPILPSGSIGQFLVKDSTGANNFMHLELEPQGLSFNKIAVGDSANYLAEYDNFEFREGRYVAIFKNTDPTKAFYMGMYGGSNNSFVTASGGSLVLKGDNGIYLDGFTGFGNRMLIVDGNGKIAETTIPTGGGGGGSTSLGSELIGFGSPTNTVTGVSRFKWIDNRVIKIDNAGSSNIEIGRKFGTDNYGLFVNNGDLELFSTANVNVSLGATSQFKVGDKLRYYRSTNSIQLDSDYTSGEYLTIGNPVGDVFWINAINAKLSLSGTELALGSTEASYMTFQNCKINWDTNDCVNGWSSGGTPQEGDEVTLIFSGGEFKLKRKV